MSFTRTQKNMPTSTTFTGKRPSLEHQDSSNARTYSDDPSRVRFGHHLPRDLRQGTRDVNWQKFKGIYSPTNGPVQIKNFEATRGTLGRWNSNADLLLTDKGDHTRTLNQEIIAIGLVSVCTNLLADAGYRVEITRLHQFETFEATATFVYVGHNNDHVWTVGSGQTLEVSAFSALVCAANRLHG